MKNVLIVVMLLTGFFIVSGASAQIVDAPHNASVSMSCSDCHIDPYSFIYTDDMCLSCHNNTTGGGYSLRSAPKVLTHSSGNTSSKYGNWSTQCLDCHSKHTWEQRAVYQSGIFLVTGTITSITDNGDGTTTFGYSDLVEQKPGWADYTKWNKKSSGNFFGGNERGLILYPNTTTYQNQSSANFEMSSATATTMTVKGSINTAFPKAISSGLVTVGKPFALAYGQFVNSTLITPSNLWKPSHFIENSGIFSFAYSTAIPPSTKDPSVDSICQVCHTQTLHWRADGTLADHYNSQDCATCHKHEEGFKVSCDVCHLAPPTTGKHTAHFDAGLADYGSTTIQSTPAAYGFSCGICHDGTHLNTTANPRSVEVVFAGVARQDGATGASYAPSTFSLDDPGRGYSFNYSNGSCSNVYCHGNYPGSGKNASVTFGTGTAPCGSCHNASNTAPPASGSHVAHASNMRYNLSCSLCHAGEISGVGSASYTIADKQKHVSGNVDWAFDTGDTRVSLSSGYSIPSGTAMPSNGTVPRPYGTCSTTYCHSDGTSVAALNLQPNVSPVWGSGSLGCTACHGMPPAYPNGSPKANGHTAHADNACSTCHAVTTSDGITITSFANHVNRTYDVNPDVASGATFTYTFGATGGSCTNISCHGGNTATWGGPPLKCSNCHLGPQDADDYLFGNGIIAMASASQWSSTGHGRPATAGNYLQSGNPAASFDAAAGTGDSCLYCHDNTVGHNVGPNPFRLRWTIGPDGQNGNCQKCHKPGSTGYVSGVDGTLPSMNASAATKMEDYHWLMAPGGKHTNVRNGGRFCWDCHDPHGDMNVAMVHDAVAKRSDWNGTTGFGLPTLTVVTSFTTMNTWGSYVNPSGTGVCQVCHEITSHFTGSTNYNTNHNPGASCTGCHSHLGSASVNGDAFPGAESGGGVACGGCHNDLYTRMNSAANTTYHHLLTSDAPTYASGTCLQCHVDHNIFRPDVNTANTVGRSANLRTNINIAVPSQPTTVGYTNTDFLSADTDGGICLSCHKAQLAKGYPQSDATTVTPAVGKADYQASGHQYVAASTFGTGGSTFNANCSKCHNDTLSPKSSFNAQSSANKFGNHSSTLRRILAALGIASPADPLEEQFCYQCHSGAGPNDYYGVKAMSAASRDIQTVFGKTYKHNVAGYSGQHRSSTTDETLGYISANKHVECEDCHNPHAAQPGTHTRGSAALANVLKGVDGAIASYPSNTNWPATGTPPRSNFTYAATQTSTAEYQICFKCHSYANTNVQTWGGTGAAAWTDVGLEFDPNNQSYHPVVQALPATDPNANYGSNRLASAQLSGGWTPGQVMTCSDCHDSDSAASTGPHGSAVKWMLGGTNKSWPYQGTAGNGTSSGTFWTLSNRTANSGTANGLFCLNCHTLNASGHIHFKETDHQRIACVGCHVRVPHGYRESRLIAAGTVPARYYPNGNGGGTKYINRFTKASNYSNYSESNCSTVNGCH